MQNNKTIVAILVLFTVLAQVSKAQDKIVDQIVAIVGGNVILKSDIENAYQQSMAQGVTTAGDMRCEILENLLIERLMVAEAELDTNITVTDNQINQNIEARIQYFIQNLGNEKAVEEYFKKPIGLLRSELKDIVRNESLSGQMKQKIIENIKVTPSEIRQYYRNMPDNEKPMVNTQYEYAQISVFPQVDEEEQNRLKDELREMKRRIEAGENFATFAVLHSECPSARQGGDLGYFGRASMDPAFSAAAFNLRPGQISNVVKSEFGFHIIQMIDRKGDRVHARHILMKPKANSSVIEKSVAQLDSIANEIRKGTLKFEEAAMRYSMDVNSRNNGGRVVQPFSMVTKFEATQLAPEVARVLTKLEINEISKPFKMIDDKQRDNYVIVKLMNKTEAHKANLQDDYEMLSELFLQKKQSDAVQDWISKRQSKTYIRIDDTYRNCDFEFKNWVK